MQRRITTTGLTLIEAIIYVALFGLIIATGLAATYNLIDGSETLNEGTLTDVEAHFILHRLGYEIKQVATATTPVSDTLMLVDDSGGTTTITRIGASGTIAIMRNDSDPIPLHSDVLEISYLRFDVVNGSPQSVLLDMTIEDRVFNNVRYYLNK